MNVIKFPDRRPPRVEATQQPARTTLRERIRLNQVPQSGEPPSTGLRGRIKLKQVTDKPVAAVHPQPMPDVV